MSHAIYSARLTGPLSCQRIAETGETLIYDEERHLAFCLDRVASAIFQAADGCRSQHAIREAVTLELGRPVSDADVLSTLERLCRDGLLAEVPQAGALRQSPAARCLDGSVPTLR